MSRQGKRKSSYARQKHRDVPQKEPIKKADIAPEQIPQRVPKPNDDLDADDTAVLSGDDDAVFEGNDLSVFKQEDKVVSWRIDNLYNEKGKLRSRFLLRQSPPIWRIESNDGTTVELLLTKNLAASLKKAFTKVYDGYFGIEHSEHEEFSQKTVRSFVASVWKKIISHKVRWIVLLVCITAFIVLPLIFK